MKEAVQQPGQPERGLGALLGVGHEHRQDDQRKGRREEDTDGAEDAELPVAVHRRGRHHGERRHRGQGPHADGEHQPAKVLADAPPVLGRAVVQVVDDMDGVVDGDADRDGAEAGGDGGQMLLPEGQHDAGDERADERRDERDQRQPAPAIGGQAEHQHHRHPEEDAAGGVPLDQGGVVHAHPVSARDGHVHAGEGALDLRHQRHQIRDQRRALAAVGRGKGRLRHDQCMAAVPAHDPAVLEPGFAEAGLERQDFFEHERAHGDRVGRNDIFQDHPLGPCELAAHHGEVGTDLGRFQLARQRPGVVVSEQVGEGAGQKIDRPPLAAQLEPVENPAQGTGGGQPVIHLVRSAAERFRVRLGGGHPHVEVDPIDLPELPERITVVVHHRVVLGEDGEDVLLEIDPQREEETDEGDEEGSDHHRPPVGDEPEIHPGVEISLHAVGRGGRSRR